MLDFLVQDERVLPYLNNDLHENDDFVSSVLNHETLGKHVILKMCTRNWKCIAHLPDEWKKDKDVILAAVEQDLGALEVVGELYECLDDKDIVMKAVIHDVNVMTEIDTKLWDCIDLVLVAVKQDYHILEEAPDFSRQSLWQHEDIIFEAVRQDPRAIFKTVKVNWGIRELVLLAVSGDWTVMERCPKELANEYLKDREMALTAVKQTEKALKKFDASFWEDEEIMLTAVKHTYTIIDQCDKLTAKKHYQDRAIVMEMCRQNGLCLKDADVALFDDLEVVLIAVKQNWTALQKFPKYHQKLYWNDLHLARYAIEGSEAEPGEAENLAKCGEAVRENKELVLKCVEQQGLLLQYASEDLQNDKDVVRTALNQDVHAIEFASKAFRSRKDIMKDVLTEDGTLIRLASEAIRDDLELMRIVVKQDGTLIQYASDDLRNSYDLARTAVKQTAAALELLPEDLQADERVLACAKKT